MQREAQVQMQRGLEAEMSPKCLTESNGAVIVALALQKDQPPWTERAPVQCRHRTLCLAQIT